MGNQQATSCCICLEKKRSGVPCSNKHLTCKECFPQYVKSCYENGAKFCDQGFVIRCPDPGCMSNPITVQELRANLPENVLDSYVEALVRYNNRMKAGEEIPKESTKQQLVDALNLKCPSCRSVLDQNPDGCCAIRCITCGTHFCWLCFQICSGSITCHTHVGSCQLNPSRNLFAPADVVKAAHKIRRARQIHAVLKAAHDPTQHGTVSWKETNQTRTLLNDCLKSLKMNDLTPNSVLTTPEKEDRPAPPAPVQPQVAVLQWIQQNQNGAIIAGALVLIFILSKLFSPGSSAVGHMNASFHTLLPYTTVHQETALDEDISSSLVSTKVLSISLCPKHETDTDERYIDFTKFSATSSVRGSASHSKPTSGSTDSPEGSRLVHELISGNKGRKTAASKAENTIQPFLCIDKSGLHLYHSTALSTSNSVAPSADTKSHRSDSSSSSTTSGASSGGPWISGFTFWCFLIALVCSVAAWIVRGLNNRVMHAQDRQAFLVVFVIVGVCFGSLPILMNVLWFVWTYSGTLFLIIAIGGGIYANMQGMR